MNCSDARVRLYPYLDGELSPDEQENVGRHLGGCEPCSTAFNGERALFAEIRRHADALAPAGLRARISAGLGHAPAAAPPALTGSRPWPFARALVPAAAAALLVAVLVTVMTQPLEADVIARRAVAWHELPHGNAAFVSGAPEAVSFFTGRKQKSCMHERTVGSGMEYDYKSASIDDLGPAGTVTCWWTADCPKSGTRMSHARFPIPAGAEESLLKNPRRRIPVGSRVVLLHYQNGFV
jgi:anti-sigma factor (TIGR02949 family)